jgi:Domain of unknown function (DUF4258)
MKLREPIILLFLWLVLPVGVGYSRFLVAQVLLSQIRAIHTARRAEKKLNLDLDNDSDEAFREFLSALWFDPGNATAYAYVGLLTPCLGLLNHQNGERMTDSDFTLEIKEIRRKIASDEFEFSKHAVDQSILRQIRVHEIKEVIANGQLIEDYPTDKYGSSCLICGLTQAGRAIHVQCSYPTRPLIKIITVYEPDPERWNDNFIIRRTSSDDE